MYPPQLSESFLSRPWGIYPHALFGSAALILGAFQFRRDLLRRRRPLHRTLGKMYVIACLLVGAAGLYMAGYSFGGWPTHVGFGLLAVALLYTTVRAYLLARSGNIVEHREWMVRSYALIFAAVMLRLELPLLILTMRDFAPAYAVVSWLSWVPNLLWAEWYVRRSRTRETPLVQALVRG